MSQIMTDFSPIKNGFQFVNRFEYHFNFKYPLPFVGEVDLRDLVIGLCGGMCFAALDYFYAKTPRPDFSQPDAIDSKLLVYLCERQLASMSIPVLMKVFEWMMIEDKEIAARMTRMEIPKLRRALDKGSPVVLLLIRARGMENPTKNHQVLATGYSYNETAKLLTIELYDPNHPNQEPTICLDLSRPSQGLNLQESTGEETRGFFVVPYTPSLTLPKPPEPVEAFAPLSFDIAQPTIQLCWPVDSDRINQKFGENPDSYAPFGLPGHEGVDLFAPEGANVYAAADGQVYEADYPSGHPYGLHIRIVHQAGTVTYRTIYGHLHEIYVHAGQNVKAGGRIALADNTGNSFGSHLHLTLKIDGAKTPGYPDGIVDPLPYLQGAVAVTPPVDQEKPPAPSGVTVYTTSQVNLRAQPNTNCDILAALPSGESLTSLGDAAAIRAKVGQQGEWIQVQTASGKIGWVAAWYLSADQPFPPSDLVVYPDDKINLRSGPGTTFAVVASLEAMQPLTVLGDAATAKAKIGQQGQWIQVQTSDGKRGFVAAWFVHLTAQPPVATGLTVYPTDTINVRARPATDAAILTKVTPADALTVLGDANQARQVVGMQGQWINVRTPGGFTGYVAAWYVSLTASAPQPSSGVLMVYPTSELNLRAQASANSPKLTTIPKGSPLTVLDTDQAAARAKVGQQGQWLYVQKPGGARGWVAAWYTSLTK